MFDIYKLVIKFLYTKIRLLVYYFFVGRLNLTKIKQLNKVKNLNFYFLILRAWQKNNKL